MGSKYYSSLLRLYYLQSLEKLPVNTTVAFSGFTTCNLWKKWPVNTTVAFSALKWPVNTTVAFSGFTTCNLWKKKASKL